MTESRWYTSSSGEGVSLTIKGVITALVPVIIGISRYCNVEISENEIMELLNAALTAASAFMIIYGLGRKAYYKFFRKSY